ncbi:hypothetical protein SEUCBS139899_002305 [Sporothrix eucalyptigena]|uniref:Ubiquitin-like-conjugating enzyme ATG10 n=1 Tax=Sporothrix eucalyptigena TaxID=1812306 RepID=A0ABP0BVW7_9PEZI
MSSTTETTTMSSSMGSDFRDYPFLSHDEFGEVCHDFDRIYRQATLGPLRRRWRVSVCTAFSTSFVGTGGYDSGSEFTTYLQITRPLDPTEHDDALAHVLDKFSFGAGEARMVDGDLEEDEAMAQAEDADAAALPPSSSGPAPNYGYVTYEIHLHPTYRAPCLWFSLHGLPNNEPAFNIDTVFRHLVPTQFQDRLRAMGSIGGISADYHPITGVPSFFVHPCLLGEAMTGFDCTKKSYMMVWLGLVGGCVGLWVPKEMAMT